MVYGRFLMTGESGDKREGARGVLDTAFVGQAATVVAMVVGALLALLVLLAAPRLLLVLFGGVLLAVLLRALSDPLAARLRLGPGWALLLVVISIVALSLGAVLLLGPGALREVERLADDVPDALANVRETVAEWPIGWQLVMALERLEPREALGRAMDLVSASGIALVYFFTFLFVGLFLSARPSLYVSGLIRLFPRSSRGRVREVLRVLGRTIRWFLIGRLLAMTMVGVSTAAVLALLGVPLPVVLGALAGLLTFAPYLGPILGGVPIVLVALIVSPTLALWSLLAYTAVQWVEGYVLDPLIQQRMVELPPAITITSQVALGLVAGAIGVALATPLAAVLMVLVQMLWVQGVLKDDVRVGPRGLRRGSSASPKTNEAESSPRR